MQRNNDPQQIIMSIEAYNNLVAMADTSPRYSTKLIRRHVRKMNPFLQPAHQKAVREAEIIRTKRIREARAFFEANHGKLLYAEVDLGSLKQGDDPVYFPCVSERIDTNRQLIRIHHVLETGKAIRTRKVTANSLTTVLPEGYIQGVMQFREYMVKENGPYDLRKQEQDRAAALKQYVATLTDKSDEETLVER
ncbi:hypothetical protein [Pseudomonas phage vB_PaeM_PS119XW]|uniref:Uncharacterized protein n=1 Tax=Pseudomonas phage vB_PaeM_PS119XW TaxID=2601632 RepID=A0A5C1K750_9CAUD|nr:hypothetical protein PP933_gp249 [Pseudomonas phage vB_PaeM_PS119XW]QEM41978.1 hypothetical protein [Pseudomonas phage vB_PaeM_PS119XW]